MSRSKLNRKREKEKERVSDLLIGIYFFVEPPVVEIASSAFVITVGRNSFECILRIPLTYVAMPSGRLVRMSRNRLSRTALLFSQADRPPRRRQEHHLAALAFVPVVGDDVGAGDECDVDL